MVNNSAENSNTNQASTTENQSTTIAEPMDVDKVNKKVVTKMTLYEDRVESKVTKELNYLTKHNYKPIQLKTQDEFLQWWNWLTAQCKKIGLGQACQSLLKAINKEPPQFIVGNYDEEEAIKTLIRDSVTGIAINDDDQLSAQEWLRECINLVGMKQSLQTLENLRRDFNISENKTKQALYAEWKLLKLKHDLQNVELNETHILDRFITYVASNNLAESVEKELIELNKLERGKVLAAINRFYEWKEGRKRYEADKTNATIATVNSGGVNSHVPQPNNPREPHPRTCHLCKSPGHLKFDCPLRRGCFTCGDPNHHMQDCKQNQNRLNDERAINNGTYYTPHNVYRDRANNGYYNANKGYNRGNFGGRGNRGRNNYNSRGRGPGNSKWKGNHGGISKNTGGRVNNINEDRRLEELKELISAEFNKLSRSSEEKEDDARQRS